VIDLVDGVADIEKRLIRFIGEPELRITEDYLRILRFFRFFAWYGSGRPDAAGLKAAARLKGGLAKLSAERVWSELKKLLSAKDPGRALLWMRQAGVLTEVLPETEKWGIDAIPGLVDAEEAFGWTPDPLLRLMAMVPPDAGRVEAMAKRLRLSRAEAARLAGWATASSVSHDIADLAFERLLYASDRQGVVDRLRLSLAGARVRARTDIGALAEAGGYSRLLGKAEKWQRPVFPVSGKDLLAEGFEEGSAMGATLGRLEEAWVESNFTLTRRDLLAKAAAPE
jgi:tRNA nucleotidyltransferase/poly(A) polymerase